MNTNNLKKALCMLTTVAMVTVGMSAFAGCNNKNAISSATTDEPVATTLAISTDDEAKPSGYLKSIGIDTDTLGIEHNILHDSNSVGFQLDPPQQGDTIAILHTNMGDITIRFFPAQAPKAVTNFINLAKNGKYNNTLFSKVTDGFMINGGYCGTSSYGSEFEDEFCDKLFNIRGAVSMSNKGKDTNESAFFINQKSARDFKAEGGWDYLDSQWNSIKTHFANYKDSNLLSAFIDKNGTNCYNTELVPNEVRKLYENNGGNAYLDGAYNAVDRGYTVFAQVISGMDVVDKIAKAEVSKDNVPKQNIIIKSVELSTYEQQTQTTTVSTTEASE